MKQKRNEPSRINTFGGRCEKKAALLETPKQEMKGGRKKGKDWKRK